MALNPKPRKEYKKFVIITARTWGRVRSLKAEGLDGFAAGAEFPDSADVDVDNALEPAGRWEISSEANAKVAP